MPTLKRRLLQAITVGLLACGTALSLGATTASAQPNNNPKPVKVSGLKTADLALVCWANGGFMASDDLCVFPDGHVIFCSDLGCYSAVQPAPVTGPVRVAAPPVMKAPPTGG